MKVINFISHSGGLDSTTMLYKSLNEKIDTYTVNFDYGQLHAVELLAQKRIISKIKNNSKLSEYYKGGYHIDLKSIMNSIKSIQELHTDGSMKESTDLQFYVPFRNLIFTSLTSMISEIVGMSNYKNEKIQINITFGIHEHTDVYAKKYWDTEIQFIDAIDNILKLNDGNKLITYRAYSPYKGKYKSEILDDVVNFKVPWELTNTCYSPNENSEYFEPCNVCEACEERLRGALESKQWMNEYKDHKLINRYKIYKGTKDEN